MVLGLNDLRKVLDELYTICSKWYYIGLRLDVPAEMLEKIEADTEANDHHSCLRKVIVDWLKTGKATWLALCQALRHFTIDQAKLADTIQAKYQIGKLKISIKGYMHDYAIILYRYSENHQ